MTTACAGPRGSANLAPEAHFQNSSRRRSLGELIVSVAERLWPEKTDGEMAYRTGTSDRACRYLIERRAGVSGETLAALLRSEHGFQFLKAVMHQDPPAWWASFEAEAEIAIARAELAELESRARDLSRKVRGR